jgi:hypothetical protein
MPVEANTRAARVPVPRLESRASSAEAHSSERTPAQLGAARVLRKLSARARATLEREAGLEELPRSPTPQPTAEAPKAGVSQFGETAGLPSSAEGAGEVEELGKLEAALCKQLEGLGRSERRRAERALAVDVRRVEAPRAKVEAGAHRRSCRRQRDKAGEDRRRRMLSVAQRRAEASEKARAFEEKRLAEWAAENPGQPIPKRVWLLQRIMRASKPEEAVRGWLRWARWAFGERGARALWFIEQAALCPDAQGRYRFDWKHPFALRTAIVMLMVLMMAEAFRGRRGEALCVRGITIGAMQELVRDEGGHTPEESWFSDRYTCRRCKCQKLPEAERPLHHQGLLARLERVGFIRRVQLPAQAATVEGFERFPDRNGVQRTSNRYYLPWSDESIVFDIELERTPLDGRNIRRAPRTAAERLYAEKRSRARAPD